jgi:linoleoyl-CoA desaturase
MANYDQTKRDMFIVGTFVANKITYLAIMFIILLALIDLPVSKILLGAILVTCVESLIFVYLLIGTHHCEEVDYPNPDDKGRVKKGWAHHQLATSMDWSPLSPLACFTAGGANAHAAHHLFPNFSHVHYIPITGITQEEAERHGMPYHQTTLPKMLASHFRHLHKLGRGEGSGAEQGGWNAVLASRHIREASRPNVRRRLTKLR